MARVSDSQEYRQKRGVSLRRLPGEVVGLKTLVGDSPLWLVPNTRIAGRRSTSGMGSFSGCPRMDRDEGPPQGPRHRILPRGVLGESPPRIGPILDDALHEPGRIALSGLQLFSRDEAYQGAIEPLDAEGVPVAPCPSR